jgi:uncharacterized membrane protein YdjX (TVP38/TMEM64 family)
LNVPQNAITIAVPARDRPERVTSGRILAMPFDRKRGRWRREDGRPSTRPHPEETRTRARAMTSKKTSDGEAKWKWIAAGAAALALIASWHLLPLEDWLHGLGDRIEGMGALGGVAYFALYVVAALLFMPGSILTLGAGYLFGIAGGMAVVWTAVTSSAAIGFLVARHLARDPVERLARRNARFGAIDEAIGKNGWKTVVLLRLSAIVPFSLSNYLFGLTSVDFVPYIASTAVAMLHGSFFYVYLGAAGKSLGESGDLGPWEWALLGAGLVATVVMAVILTRVAKKQLKSGRRVPAE